MTNGITARKLALRLLAALSALCAALALAVLLPGDARTAHAAESGHAEHGADWAELSAEGGELAAGKYCLAADVKLTEDLLVSGEVTLCLNGYVLTGTGGGSVITVESGAGFTLCDCREGAADVANEINGVTYNSGVITGGSAEQGGGGAGGRVFRRRGDGRLPQFRRYRFRSRGGGHPVGGMRADLQKGQKARSVKRFIRSDKRSCATEYPKNRAGQVILPGSVRKAAARGAAARFGSRGQDRFDILPLL